MLKAMRLKWTSALWKEWLQRKGSGWGASKPTRWWRFVDPGRITTPITYPSLFLPLFLHLPHVYRVSFLHSLNRQSSSSSPDLHQIDTVPKCHCPVVEREIRPVIRHDGNSCVSRFLFRSSQLQERLSLSSARNHSIPHYSIDRHKKGESIPFEVMCTAILTYFYLFWV